MTKNRFAALLAGAWVVIVCARLFAAASGSGSVSLTAFGVPFGQDFHDLAITGSSSALPEGWFIDETGTSAAVNGSYTAGTGTSNAGDTYSFGPANTNERALGMLRSGTLAPTIGAAFVNNTGATIASFLVSYTGEQWRLGAANRGADRLDFQYSTDATSLTTGTWTNVDALDFIAPDAGAAPATAGPRDGNTFRSFITGQLTGIAIAPGQRIWIRWLDFDVSNADDGLAVDDFSIAAQQAVGPTGSGTGTPASAGGNTTLSFVVTPGNPPAGIASVVVDLTAIGGANAVPMSLVSGLTYALNATVAPTTTGGTKQLAVKITEVSPSARIGTGTIALQINPAQLTIHEIQGSGSESPYAGALVQTDGIVTARRFNNGFFIQTPDGAVDADANTSEGIFVFTGTGNIPSTAQVGNLVRVVGSVQEFRGDAFSPPATEISGSPTTLLLSTGNALPNAVTIGAADLSPSGGLEQLERLEGMRVHVDALIVVAPTQGSVNEPFAIGSTNGVYFGVLPNTPRPFREPGVEVPDALPVGSPCCVTRFDANPERLRVDSNGQDVFSGTQTTEVTTGAGVTNITGVLDYASRAYTILPDLGGQGAVTGNRTFSAVNARAPLQFTVATSNLERFFDTVDDDGISDVAVDSTAFTNRLGKVALQIRDVMRLPDIIGVEEVENIGVLTAIANRVNADSGGAVNYVAYLFEGNDPGGIDDGFVVNANRVLVREIYQEGKDTKYINPNNGQPETLNDRPPTVLKATIVEPNSVPRDITVIANHLRSLNGVEDVNDSRVRVKRLRQAEYLGQLIETLQSGPAAEAVLAVGDFNAFEFSDGYVDVIGTIKGTPVPANQVVVASGAVPNVGMPLVDLIEADGTANRYSYVFDGSAQSLDHVLASQVAANMFDHIEWGHSNADFPESLRGDFTRPERLSDHDPVVAYFRLTAQTTTTLTALPNPAPFAADVTFTATVTTSVPVNSGFVEFTDGAGYSASVAVAAGAASVTVPAASFGIGLHTMTAHYSDGSTFAASTGSTAFSVVDVVAPVIDGLVNIVVEANGPSGSVVTFSPTATDDVDGSVAVSCLPPSGSSFPLGTTTVVCSASDAAGHKTSGSFTVTVRDTIAPSEPVLSVTPPVLWPPNHNLMSVVVSAQSTDSASTVTCAIAEATSSEPDNGLGDGDTAGDIGAFNGLTTMLRAERSGGGVGRVYTLTVRCTDGSGNASASTIAVTVPKNK